MTRFAPIVAGLLALLSACADGNNAFFGPGEVAPDAAADQSSDTPADQPTADLTLDPDVATPDDSDVAVDADRRDLLGDAADLSDDPDSSDADLSDRGPDVPPDPIVTCAVDGVVGECLDTSVCLGVSTPGFCPGPANIQCCTEPGVVSCTVSGRLGECIDVAECDGNRSPTPGLCPGPTEIQCCTLRPEGECDPDEHVQPNVGLSEAPGAGGCPAGMVPVDGGAFCIDQYEAALVEVLDGGGITPWSPYQNPGTRRVRAVSIAGAVPQGYITGLQAESACLEAGKRLCTDAEWLRACRGEDDWTYPYGANPQAGACNENRPLHPAVEYFGTSADWIWSELGNACISQLPDSLATTGAYDECVTPEAVYDLVGNLHEWTANTSGVFRGGFYVDTWRNGTACLYATTAHNRLHWDYSTGFRCCAD